jgi:hypothetical protein
MTSYLCYNDGNLLFKCDPLRDAPSIVIADIDGHGLNDVIFLCRNDCQSRVFVNRNLSAEGHPWGPAKASIRAMAVADADRKGNFGSGIQFQKPDALELGGKEKVRMLCRTR